MFFLFAYLKKYSAPRVCMWMVIFLCLVRKTLLLKWIESKVQDFKMDKSIIKNQEILHKYGKKHTLSLMNNFSKSRERKEMYVDNYKYITHFKFAFLAVNFYIYIYIILSTFYNPFLFHLCFSSTLGTQILLLCIFTFFKKK